MLIKTRLRCFGRRLLVAVISLSAAIVSAASRGVVCLACQYRPAFTPTQHEALGPENIFLARWRKDGTLAPAH